MDESSGAVYVFEWDGSTWNKMAKLVPDDGASYRSFGGSVSADGHRVLAGSNGAGPNGVEPGSAYVFEWDNSAWVQTAKLLPDEAEEYDSFGNSVSLSGDRALIGSDVYDKAYVFEWQNGAWAQRYKLLPEPRPGLSGFGFSVSLDGSRAVIARPVYVFAFSTGTGTEGDGAAVPAAFVLRLGYPNPFNGSVRLTLDLPKGVPVRLAVYDVLGREVARLTDGVLPAGRHGFTWEAGERPGWVYVVRMEAGSYVVTRPFVLVR